MHSPRWDWKLRKEAGSVSTLAGTQGNVGQQLCNNLPPPPPGKHCPDPPRPSRSQQRNSRPLNVSHRSVWTRTNTQQAQPSLLRLLRLDCSRCPSRAVTQRGPITKQGARSPHSAARAAQRCSEEPAVRSAQADKLKHIASGCPSTACTRARGCTQRLGAASAAPRPGRAPRCPVLTGRLRCREVCAPTQLTKQHAKSCFKYRDFRFIWERIG